MHCIYWVLISVTWYKLNIVRIYHGKDTVVRHAPWRHKGEEAQLHSVTTSMLDRRRGHDPDALPAGQNTDTHWSGGSVGPRSGLDVFEDEKISKRVWNSGSSSPQTRRCTYWAIPWNLSNNSKNLISITIRIAYRQIHFHPVQKKNVNKKPSKRGLTQSNVLAKYTTECREKKWIVSEKKDLTIKLFYITTHNTITYTCQFLYLLVGMGPIFACFFEQLSVFKCRNNEQVLQISITILKTKARLLSSSCSCP